MMSAEELKEFLDKVESVNFIGQGHDLLILDNRTILPPFYIEWKRDGVFVQFIDNDDIKRVKAEGTRVGDLGNAHYYLRTVQA